MSSGASYMSSEKASLMSITAVSELIQCYCWHCAHSIKPKYYGNCIIVFDINVKKSILLHHYYCILLFLRIKQEQWQPGENKQQANGKAMLVEWYKRTKWQISHEKLFTHCSLVLAPFTTRVSLTVSLIPGVMWKGKWDNAQPIILTARQPFEQHSAVIVWLTPSVAAFLPNWLAVNQGSPSQARCCGFGASWLLVAALPPSGLSLSPAASANSRNPSTSNRTLLGPCCLTCQESGI